MDRRPGCLFWWRLLRFRCCLGPLRGAVGSISPGPWVLYFLLELPWNWQRCDDSRASLSREQVCPCVVETQVAKDRVLCLTRTLGFHDCYAVDSDGRSGGLGIFGRKVWILRSYGTKNTTFIKEGKTRWSLYFVCNSNSSVRSLETSLSAVIWYILKRVSHLSTQMRTSVPSNQGKKIFGIQL